MRILKLTIWGLCCLLILVALTCSSFPKFRLLWIPLLPIIGFLALLLLYGLWAAFAFSVAKLIERNPKKKKLDVDEFPPFGALKWSGGEWSGKIQIPAWAGFQSRGGAYGSQDSDAVSDGSARLSVKPNIKAETLTPTEGQCRAMQFQIENGQAVVQSVLAALLPYHLTMKKEWELDDELMPPVTSVEDFRKQIGLSQVHVLEHEVDGMAYIGLELGCEWEDEHGLGIVVRGSRVVEIGEADIAFCWRPDEPATNQEVS